MITIGEDKIKDIYVGEDKIVKAYRGDQLIYAGLPSGYTAVEAIQGTTGDEYIDLGHKGDDEKEYELHIKGLEVVSGVAVGSFGDWVSGQEARSIELAEKVTSNSNIRFGNNLYSSSLTFGYERWWKMNIEGIWRKSSLNADYQLARAFTDDTPFETVNNLILFNYSTTTTRKAKWAVWELKERDHSTNQLLHWYLPVRRNSDSVYGLYDVISQSFHGNSGSGEITVYNTTE